MSKYILVRLIADHSAETTIKEFIQIFNEHGIPQELPIDKGSNFTSKTFMDFCKSLDVNVTYSSTCHHSSNPTKWAVQTVKNLMKKYKCTNQSWHLALLEYSCILISDTVPSSSVLCGHAFKGLLSNFYRNNNNNLSFSDSLQERHDKEKSHFNVNSKELSILPVGSIVMVYDHQIKCWKLGKVDGRHSDNNCSYFCQIRKWNNSVQKSSQFKTNISAICGEVNTES